MMESKIIFSFSSNGNELILGEKEYAIVDYEGIEATDYELEKKENINHIGAKKKRMKLLPRPISIEFDYMGNDENKYQKRQELIGFFSPFRAGFLTVNYMGEERMIKYEVTGFRVKSKNIYDTLSCLLELTCMDPAFESILQYGDEISTWISGWSWPFTLPFHMRLRGEQKKNIYNGGHLETPVEVIFRGPAVRPEVRNVTTGESIIVQTTLSTDDVLHITTAFGNKTVMIETKNGLVDAFDLIHEDTRFFGLVPGDNMIEYSTQNDTDPQGVEIRYRERYLGI